MDGQWELFSLRTGARFALAGPMLLTALLALASGVLAFASVATSGVVGFLFGPVLGALGLCLIALFAFNAFGSEELRIRSGIMERCCRLGGLRWGRKELRIKDGQIDVRLRTRGALGFCLEFISGPEMVIVGAGSTRRCLLPPAVLLKLGEYVMSFMRHGKVRT